MIEKAKKCLAIILAIGLLPVFAGCGQSGTVTAAIPNEDNSVSATEEKQTEVPVEYYADAPDKSETVTVKTSSDGTPEKVTVSVTLARRDEKPIQDKTILTNIKNTEGNESYKLSDDGTLIWENKGRNISYEGQADVNTLPVGVHFSYELDGKPISAKQIEGKSGEVTINISYDNNSEELLGGFVPFTAITMLMLGDNFYNVDVDNGSEMTVSGSTVVLGYALPGLSDALQLTNYELFKDTEVPESVKITAYTTDFDIEFSTTAFSNGILSDMDEEDIKDLDDIYNDSCDTSNGLLSLEDAGETVSSVVVALINGITSVSQSAAQLSQAISGAAAQAAAISVPGAVNQANLISTEGLSDDALAAAEAANEQIAAANTAIAAYNNSVGTLSGQVSALQGTLNTISSSLSGTSTDTSSASAVNEGINSYISTVDSVCESLRNSMWTYAGSNFYTLKDNLKKIRDNDIAYTNFSGCYDGQSCEVAFIFETDD